MRVFYKTHSPIVVQTPTPRRLKNVTQRTNEPGDTVMNSRLIGLETGEEQLLNKPSLVTCESHQVYSLIEIS